MLVIGADTITFCKTFEPSIVERYIKGHLQQRGELFWLHGIFCAPHYCLKNTYSFSCSAATMSSETEDNFIPATPENIATMIARFKEITGLDVSDATLSRLDITMMIEVERSVRAYYRLMHKRRGYDIHPEENGQYLNSKSGEMSVLLYDKELERFNKGKPRYSETEEKNLLRIELRFLRHMSRYMKLPAGFPKLTLDTLAHGHGFWIAVRAFEHHVMRLLDLRQYGKLPGAGSESFYDSVLNEATAKMMALHPLEYQHIIDSLVDKYGADEDKRTQVMDRFDNLTLEPIGRELHEGISRVCKDVYAVYQEEIPASELSKDFTRSVRAYSKKKRYARNPELRAQDVITSSNTL